MLDILLFTVLGIIAGIITGLLPGIHVNTVTAGLLLITAYLSKFSPLAIAAFICTMAITNAFTNFIPSVFLGAPDAETALSILPGHALLNKGLGYHAVRLTVIGGLGTFVVAVISFIPLAFFLKPAEPYITLSVPYILIAVSIIIVARESDARTRVWSLLVFLLSGVLGLLVLNHLNMSQALFPLLSGLFGVSGLLLSSARNEKIPEQKMDSTITPFSIHNIMNYCRATLSSLIVSVVPAIGAAEAATMALGFKSSQNEGDYLMIVGGIGTAAAMYTLVVFYLIGAARSGAIAAMKEFLTPTTSQLIILVIICLVAAIVSAFLTLLMAKYLAKYLWKLDYKWTSYGIVGLIVVMVLLMSGWVGLVVLAVSTAIGLIPPLAGVKRIHAMGCLMIPVLSFYLL